MVACVCGLRVAVFFLCILVRREQRVNLPHVEQHLLLTSYVATRACPCLARSQARGHGTAGTFGASSSSSSSSRSCSSPSFGVSSGLVPSTSASKRSTRAASPPSRGRSYVSAGIPHRTSSRWHPFAGRPPGSVPNWRCWSEASSKREHEDAAAGHRFHDGRRRRRRRAGGQASAGPAAVRSSSQQQQQQQQQQQ